MNEPRCRHGVPDEEFCEICWPPETVKAYLRKHGHDPEAFVKRVREVIRKALERARRIS